MADVFISYRNTPDRRLLVKRLAILLRAHELTVWWDYGLEAGESFRVQITEELSRSKVVVPLWCQESIASKWVLMEAELGFDRLVPARLQNVIPPREFAAIQSADLIGWGGSVDDLKLTALVRKICQRVGRSPHAPVDMLEAFRDLPPLPPLPSDEVSGVPVANANTLLSDLRATWNTFQGSDDLDAVTRFFEHVTRMAPGTGLEFEIREHLEKSRPVGRSPDAAAAQKPSRATPAASKTKQPKNADRNVQPGSVIGLASGKGGVGKSWLATSMAVAFANRPLRTLLVDADFGSANIDVLLGIAPETDLAAVVAGWVEIEDAICRVNGGAGTQGGFDVLPGRSGSGALGGLPAELASRLAASITALALQYDVVIVDLATGLEDNVLRMARACTDCVVVASDEPTSMTDAYGFLKSIDHYAPSLQVWVLTNMVDTPVSGRRTYEAIARACQTFLKKRPLFAGVVTKTALVPNAIKMQRTIYSVEPGSKTAAQVGAVVDELVPVSPSAKTRN